MSYNHNLVKIEKEDLFLLLRIRYKKNYKDLQLDGRCDQSPLFLETIEMIQNYDAWLLLLKFGKIETWEAYETMASSNKERINLAIFNLCYKSKFLPEWNGLEIPALRKVIEYSTGVFSKVGFEEKKESNLAKLFNDYCRDKRVFIDDRDPGVQTRFDESLIKNYFSIHEVLQSKIRNDKSVDHKFNMSKTEVEDFQYFNSTIERLGKLYILCLDIRLCTSSFNQQDYSGLLSKFEREINCIKQLVDQTANLVSYLLRVEPMQEIGLNLHFVLMFDGNFPISESGIISQLELQISETPELASTNYVIQNWNDGVREFVSKHAVGLINKRNSKARYDCWYWVYSFFYSIDQVIYLNNKGFSCTQDIVKKLASPTKPILLNLSKEQQELEVVKQTRLHDVLDLFDDKKYLDSKHLPDITRDYLHIVGLVSPTTELLQQVSCFSQLPSNHTIMLIELFCETLKIAQPKLFNLVHPPSYSYSSKFYYKSLSRLGRIWLSLLNKLSKEESFLTVAKLTTFKSKNLLNFLHFNKAYSGQLLNLINQPISVHTIRASEIIFENFKHKLEEDTQIKQFKELKGRFEKLLKYADFLFEKDVLVIRLHLKFSSTNGALGKNDQSKILTEFLRVGRSAKPLCWLRGYILRWDRKDYGLEEAYLYADLTLFFEYESIRNMEVFEALEKYLKSFIDRCNGELPKEKLTITKDEMNDSNQLKEKDDKKIKGSKVKKPILGNSIKIIHTLEQVLISDIYTEMAGISLKVETVDTVMKKVFKKVYIPYIYYLDLFNHLEVSDQKIKRFTTGQIPNTKSISMTARGSD
ncbi:hypothetical protein [Acinetobacter courvalinii]|uniref:hypothetical protein n=1 Tax=Acinetobacter courvalinii TaxID=280147 RepID=UPI0021CF9172|nr:hypothetical protein [Acinetobacter courvalinii]MCU4368285.1 hypothetical protein [Acinetobacter courvalinii]MCU4446655.1 hypothetical protein [Acinetobacter courvalinii]